LTLPSLEFCRSPSTLDAQVLSGILQDDTSSRLRRLHSRRLDSLPPISTDMVRKTQVSVCGLRLDVPACHSCTDILVSTRCCGVHDHHLCSSLRIWRLYFTQSLCSNWQNIKKNRKKYQALFDAQDKASQNRVCLILRTHLLPTQTGIGRADCRASSHLWRV
jgi:hypothetical protein